MSADPLAPVAALPGVAQAVAASRLAVDRFAGHRVLRRRGEAVRTESALRGAAAAAGLQLGRPVGVDEARAAVSGADESRGADPVVLGAVRTYAELAALGAVWRQAPRQALARLHTLAARDLVDAGALGRPQTGPAAERLGQLLDVLAATQAPALVVAAVVHGELATLQPFGSADRVVALAASRLVLVERGLDPGGFVVVEVGHRDLPEDEAALEGFGTGTPQAVADWVGHYAEVVRAGVQEAGAIAEAILRG